MLNRLLQYNYSAIGIFLFLVLLKTIMFLTGQIESVQNSYSLFKSFTSTSYISGIAACVFTLLLGILILTISEQNAKRTDFSYWIVLIFGIQMSLHSFYSISVEYFGLLFFIFALHTFSQGLQHYKSSQLTLQVFNLSLCISIGSLFTPHLVYTLPIFWICHIVINPVKLKGILATCLGFILPYLIADTVIFAFLEDTAQYTHLFVLDKLSNSYAMPRVDLRSASTIWAIIPLGFLCVSLYKTIQTSRTLKIVVRQFNNINIIFLSVLSLLILIRVMPYHLGILLTFVPASYFYSNFQASQNSLWRSIFITTTIISCALSYPPVYTKVIAYLSAIL